MGLRWLHHQWYGPDVVAAPRIVQHGHQLDMYIHDHHHDQTSHIYSNSTCTSSPHSTLFTYESIPVANYVYIVVVWYLQHHRSLHLSVWLDVYFPYHLDILFPLLSRLTTPMVTSIFIVVTLTLSSTPWQIPILCQVSLVSVGIVWCFYHWSPPRIFYCCVNHITHTT